MKLQVILAFSLSVAPSIGWACGTGTVQFEDNFKTPDPGWSTGPTVKLANGVMTLNPPINLNSYVTNNTYIFEKADVCAQIKNPDFVKAGDSSAGLRFWIDGSTFYYLGIYTDGQYRISRGVGTRWINLKNGSSKAIRTGKGDVNEVEVRVDGKNASAYVNGTKVEDISGQVPAGGAFFGLYGEAEKERADIWEIDDFKILSLP